MIRPLLFQMYAISALEAYNGYRLFASVAWGAESTRVPGFIDSSFGAREALHEGPLWRPPRATTPRTVRRTWFELIQTIPQLSAVGVLGVLRKRPSRHLALGCESPRARRAISGNRRTTSPAPPQASPLERTPILIPSQVACAVGVGLLPCVLPRYSLLTNPWSGRMAWMRAVRAVVMVRHRAGPGACGRHKSVGSADLEVLCAGGVCFWC